MTKEDIIKMVTHACDKDKVPAYYNGYWKLTEQELERFAELIVAKEREACALAAERLRPTVPEYDQRYWYGCTHSAQAIRSRSDR